MDEVVSEQFPVHYFLISELWFRFRYGFQYLESGQQMYEKSDRMALDGRKISRYNVYMGKDGGTKSEVCCYTISSMK